MSFVLPKKIRLFAGGVLFILLLALIYFVRPTDILIYLCIILVGLTLFFVGWALLSSRFAMYMAVTASYVLYLSWKEILYFELFLYILVIILLTEGYVVVSRRVLQ